MRSQDAKGIETIEIAKFFEATFIELAMEMAKNNKLKKGEFASLIWPELNPRVARNKWGNMRLTDSRTGKPTPCTLTDAYRIVKALGSNVAYLALKAENRVEQKFEQRNQSSNGQAGNDQPSGKA